MKRSHSLMTCNGHSHNKATVKWISTGTYRREKKTKNSRSLSSQAIYPSFVWSFFKPKHKVVFAGSGGSCTSQSWKKKHKMLEECALKRKNFLKLLRAQPSMKNYFVDPQTTKSCWPTTRPIKLGKQARTKTKLHKLPQNVHLFGGESASAFHLTLDWRNWLWRLNSKLVFQVWEETLTINSKHLTHMLKACWTPAPQVFAASEFGSVQSIDDPTTDLVASPSR